MSDMRKRYVATYFYPGSFFPEEEGRAVPGAGLADVVAAQPNNGWYGARVDEITEEVFESPIYGETAVRRGSVKLESFIVGIAHHYDSLPGADNDILRSNIRINDKSGGYGVLTRRGNWQIRSDWQTVVSPDDPAVQLMGADTPDGEPEEMVMVCACGCNIPIEDAKRSARFNSGWLNPDQAEASVESKMVPKSEVQYG